MNCVPGLKIGAFWNLCHDTLRKYLGDWSTKIPDYEHRVIHEREGTAWQEPCGILEAVHTHAGGAPVISRRFSMNLQVASWWAFLCQCLQLGALWFDAMWPCCCGRFSFLSFSAFSSFHGLLFLVCYLFCHQLSISSLLNKNSRSLIDLERQSVYFFLFYNKLIPL